MISYSRFSDFLKFLNPICHETNMVGTPHTRFDSFYITWPPLHIPIAPRAPKYRFSRKTDQDEGFFFTFCQKIIKKYWISSKMGQNGSPEAKNLFPGVFWHGDFSFDTPR